MISRRPRPQAGQLPFELPTVRDTTKPSVLLHKNGRYLLFQPQNPLAAAIKNDLIARVKDCPAMRDGRFWNVNYAGKQVVVKDWKKIEIWRHLGGDIAQHPLCQFLQANGVEVGVVPTLAGYIKKEYRRNQLENTSFPAPASTILPPSKTDVSGRKQIIKALQAKHKITFDKDLAGTLTTPENGLGRLLLDKERVWTGAEIEDLLREAMSSAAFSGRTTPDGKKDYTKPAACWLSLALGAAAAAARLPPPVVWLLPVAVDPGTSPIMA